jgi:hypothetical protein
MMHSTIACFSMENSSIVRRTACIQGDSFVTTYDLLAAAAVLAAITATPAIGQEVIYNPGYCAQFYPDANCQNKGPNNPYTGDYQRRQAVRADVAGIRPCALGVEFYRGRDGRRHDCD